ncbi:winged helix-turn-helix domain-containing protein [Streptomyces sp. NPDC051051]|uniref:ArsR/SmtB family transcription factor n=1 Tax=Streptomyces sp. NPDC051051 TaxID=3155666 RepID=UPI00342660DA
MGWWQVNADTLAGSRFVVSPLAETFACLKLLHAGVGAHPGETAWLREWLPAHRARLAADPITAALVRAGLGRDWIADFLTPTPRDGESFGDGVARVRAVRPADARAHLRTSLAGPLPGPLDRDDLPERAADLLTWVWESAVRPSWERRRRVLEADVVARTAQVSRGGWATVLDSLRPGTRWLGESRFQVNLHEYPPREISGAELLFVPVTPRAGWVSWEERERYAVVYPCSGVLAADRRERDVPAALSALLGPGRAAVLVLLGQGPLSTTQLVALTGQGLGSVGRHLRVLWDAGLVERGRVGRSVLYSRSGAGEVLVRARQESGPEEAEETEEPKEPEEHRERRGRGRAGRSERRDRGQPPQPVCRPAELASGDDY